MMKYGIYEKDGVTPIVICRDEKGEKVEPYKLRAGTKGAARRKAKHYGGIWRKD